MKPGLPSKKKLCDEPDCSELHWARGKCRNHYRRLRRGASSGLPSPGISAAPSKADWIAEVLNLDTDECFDGWPFSRSGDGEARVQLDGLVMSVHRALCVRRHGPPLGRQVTHTCPNPPCLNPNHIRWSDSPIRKLTESDVRAIRSASARGETLADVASRYEVTRQMASLIVRRERWESVA